MHLVSLRREKEEWLGRGVYVEWGEEEEDGGEKERERE